MVNNSPLLDRSFLALAHPVRRAIVERLSAGPATVGEATRGVAVSKPAVTRHLKVLEDAGVIRRRVEGRTHRLSLVPGPLGEASGWIERQRELWERKFDVIADYLEESS